MVSLDGAVGWAMDEVRLTRVVETLGSAIVDVVSWPTGGDAEVLGPRIYDPQDPAAIGLGDLVLAVNVVPNTDEARQLVERSAAGRAAAVVFKATDVAGLDDAPVAVLRVSPAVTWDQFHTLVRNVVAALPAGDPGPVGDLFSLANAVAAMVGGAVTIEDPRSNVLAYSSLEHGVDEPRRQTILGRRVPDPWTKRLRDEGIFRQMWSSPGVVRFEDPTHEAWPRLATAIRAGQEVLGSIWVVEGDRRLGAEAEAALSEAARVAALHVLRHQVSDDLDRRERGTLLRGLLEGRRSAADAAAVLAIDVNRPCAVLAFRLQLDDDVELSVKRGRVVDLITVYCEGFRRRASCAWIGDTIYVLLPSLDGSQPDRVVNLAGEIVAHAADALKVALVAGVGSTVATVGDVLQSRQEADRVLRVLCGEHDRGGTVAHIDDVRVRAILLELGDILRGRPDLTLPALESLAAHDREHSKSYLETLTAYIDAFGDVSAAAEAINLHPNSFRYRLRRLRELTGIDLSDPDDRLVIALHLRLGDRPKG